MYRSHIWKLALALVAVALTGCPSDDNSDNSVNGGTVDSGMTGDGGTDADMGSTVIHVDFGVGEPVPGFTDGGPSWGGEGCITWDPATGAPVTVTAGGEMYDADGNPIEFEPGSTVTPLGLCATYETETTVIEEYEGPPPAAGPHPECTAADSSNCPDDALAPNPPPAFRAGIPEPAPPIAHDEPANVAGSCMDGFGFSFEDGTTSGWTGLGAAPKYAVFGNNVSIKRLRPPGFYPAASTAFDDYIIERQIGGDYWEYSRDINQKGNWWYGTGDDREFHTLRPGTTLSERQTGYLVSPEFKLEAAFLSFWIGGSSDVAQRVELQILATDETEVGVLWDMHQGIGNAERPANFGALDLRPNPAELWIVQRSASPHVDGEYMGRQVVWNVDEYLDRTARLRIVDEEREPATEAVCTVPTNCVFVDKMAHINVDDFRCHDDAPEGMVTLPAGLTDDYVGHVLKPQPIWGFTESHSHATANLSFGGHMIWGDWGDELSDVYSCLHELDPIVDASGTELRPRIEDPRREISCNIKLEIVALINSTIHGICAAASAVLSAIPFVGPILAATEIAACTAVINAASAALLSVPLLIGHYYHGAQMPTSGALQMGPLLTVVQDFLVSLGLISESDTMKRIHGMIEGKDYDTPMGTHSGVGLGQFHNHYQKDMVRRAYEGGLRLMVIDVHNSRAMQAVLDGTFDYDDWQATADHIRAVERLVAPPGDPTWGVEGDLYDIAEIAYTPQHARQIIGAGKLAIILGVEVMELGKMRFDGDSIETQVLDLYAAGVRKVTAIHGTNNPLGGSGLFQDVYQSANIFNNLTNDPDGDDIAEWEDIGPTIDFTLPGDFPFPFGGMSLGTWGIAESMNAPDCGAACDWHTTNEGFFTLTANPDPDGVIGHTNDITWRLGFPSLKPLYRDHLDPDFDVTNVDSTFLGINRAHSLGWLLGSGPFGAIPSSCSLEGMFVPLEGGPPDEIEEAYDRRAPFGHFNDRSLTGQGEEFLRGMMQRGMLLDTDHFGQKTRVAAWALTRAFAVEAGYPAEVDGDDESGSDYPVFGVHTEIRGAEFGGPFPDIDDFRDHGGHESEISKPEGELRRIARAGGTITMSIPGYMRDAPYAANAVANDCDFSSKGYAHKYLWAVEYMGGVGVTPGYDMNGFAPGLAPRFGVGTACRSGIIPKALDVGGYTPEDIDSDAEREVNPHLANWPRDWQDPEKRCDYNGSMLGPWDNDCPSTEMINAQRQEFSGVIYDDYALRGRGVAPWLTSLPAGHEVVLARSATDVRDDGAPRAEVDEYVYVGGGGEFAQSRAIVKWRNEGVAASGLRNTGWDYNLDGLKHIGLMPDLMQDMRNVGVTWELLTPMFNSAEDYIAMWEKNCEMARRHATARGDDPGLVCAPR